MQPRIEFDILWDSDLDALEIWMCRIQKEVKFFRNENAGYLKDR